MSLFRTYMSDQQVCIYSILPPCARCDTRSISLRNTADLNSKFFYCLTLSVLQFTHSQKTEGDSWIHCFSFDHRSITAVNNWTACPKFDRRSITAVNNWTACPKFDRRSITAVNNWTACLQTKLWKWAHVTQHKRNQM